jgi:hypothetical protein
MGCNLIVANCVVPVPCVMARNYLDVRANSWVRLRKMTPEAIAASPRAKQKKTQKKAQTH